MKICRKCNINKEDSEFFVNNRNSDGLHSYCKPCKRKMRKYPPKKDRIPKVIDPLERTWNGIKQRCRNPNNWAYDRYGARGIDICDEWHDDFIMFKSYMDSLGRPQGDVSIDRIDNDIGYVPGNVRWATVDQQANNRGNNVRIEYEGNTGTASQLAKAYGMDPRIVLTRLKRGWTVKDALTTPVRDYNK